jgi:hypothetical protein
MGLNALILVWEGGQSQSMPPGERSGLNRVAQILYEGVQVWWEWFTSNLSWHQLGRLVDDVPNLQLVQMALYCGMSSVNYGALVWKTITWAIFVRLTWNLCHLKEHYIDMLNQVLFVALKRWFLKILYPESEWCSNSTLWSNWQCQLYGGNKVLYKKSYLIVQKSDHNPWCQGTFCCIGEGVPHQLLMGYGEPFCGARGCWTDSVGAGKPLMVTHGLA